MAGQSLAPSELSFITLCLFFEDVSGIRGRRSQKVQSFMRSHLVRPSNDLFSVLRLILPQVLPPAATSAGEPPGLPALAGLLVC